MQISPGSCFAAWIASSFPENSLLLVPLYWSYQVDTSEEKWPVLKKGFYAMRSRIPKRFLNEGSYRIEMIASIHFKQWLLEPGKDVPYVYLNIQGGLSDSPYWVLKRPTVLAPVIEWNSYSVK
jgi:lipopolysaccharide transport system ATP-binding protein